MTIKSTLRPGTILGTGPICRFIMDGVLEGLFLSLLFPQSVAALELNVPSSHRAGMGSDTLIPCTFTVDKPPVDPRFFAVHWYHQGKEILSYDDIVTSNNPAFSVDTTKALNGDASLSISGVRVSDVGIYTCSILYSPERKEKEVSFLVYAPPEITITGRIAVINKESILSSSITGFYPVDIDIKWSKDGEILNNYTISVPQRNPDDTYSVNSTVTIIPTEEDKIRTFSCRVQHESLSGFLHKNFQLEYKMKAPLEVTITGRKAVLNKESILSSSVTGFYPVDIDIKWFRNGEILNNYTITVPQRNPDGTYSVNTTVTIIPTEEDKDRNFSCRVQHESLSEPLYKYFKLDYGSKGQTNNNNPSSDENILLLGSRPHVEDIIVSDQSPWSQKVKLECKISRCDNPDSLTVTWYKQERGDLQAVTLHSSDIYEIPDLRHEIQEDNTYSCTTCLLISQSLSSAQPIEFICRVEHPSLEQPIERRIEHGKELFIEVEEIIVRDELFWSKTAKLQCKISGLYSEDLTVTWLKQESGNGRQETLYSHRNYQIPNLVYEKQSDGRYSCTACLDFTPSKGSEQRIEFICIVRHPSLELPVERRSGPLEVKDKHAQTVAEDTGMRPSESAKIPPAEKKTNGNAYSTGTRFPVRNIKKEILEKSQKHTTENKYQIKTDHYTSSEV
ncbi:tyrosine-protein phosphatase non-receptor type substrate 1-like [Pelobates fuscus]|uniref:tyrosine-protein phosphatase non-receptor type substrate 1-like n=1 Tax=Pelobates fuscus TaxID=191477 RepID=UPI002FE4E446